MRRLSESFDDVGRGIDEDALRYAQETTFTEDLGKNIFANIQKMAVETCLATSVAVCPYTYKPFEESRTKNTSSCDAFKNCQRRH